VIAEQAGKHRRKGFSLEVDTELASRSFDMVRSRALFAIPSLAPGASLSSCACPYPMKTSSFQEQPLLSEMLMLLDC
jgi:hypothetical protein